VSGTFRKSPQDTRRGGYNGFIPTGSIAFCRRQYISPEGREMPRTACAALSSCRYQQNDRARFPGAAPACLPARQDRAAHRW
jgi:hypothetical protein